jgi:hypothetical protein
MLPLPCLTILTIMAIMPPWPEAALRRQPQLPAQHLPNPHQQPRCCPDPLQQQLPQLPLGQQQRQQMQQVPQPPPQQQQQPPQRQQCRQLLQAIRCLPPLLLLLLLLLLEGPLGPRARE